MSTQSHWVWVLTFRRVPVSDAKAKAKAMVFDGEAIRAILAGSKTQERRVIDLQPQGYDTAQPAPEATWARCINNRWEFFGPLNEDRRALLYQNSVEPPWAIGDLLWCRETWARSEESVLGLIYAADDPDPSGCERGKWRPSTQMPRWACRIMLEITDVRVER